MNGKVEAKYADLWICFPFSKLRTSREDPEQQGQILALHGEFYNLGNRIVELLKVPAINVLANIQYLEILDIDLDLCLDKLRINLNLSNSEELLSDIRWPTIVAKGEYRCSICYSNSSVEADRNELLCLQSDVERCLQANLAQLDDYQQKPNWRDNFIRPLLDHVALKMAGEGW